MAASHRFESHTMCHLQLTMCSVGRYEDLRILEIAHLELYRYLRRSAKTRSRQLLSGRSLPRAVWRRSTAFRTERGGGNWSLQALISFPKHLLSKLKISAQVGTMPRSNQHIFDVALLTIDVNGHATMKPPLKNAYQKNINFSLWVTSLHSVLAWRHNRFCHLSGPLLIQLADDSLSHEWNEISSSNFVAINIILHETSDASSRSQLSILFCDVEPSGLVQES